VLEKSRRRIALRPLERIRLQRSGTNVITGTRKDAQGVEMGSVDDGIKVEVRSRHALSIYIQSGELPLYRSQFRRPLHQEADIGRGIAQRSISVGRYAGCVAVGLVVAYFLRELCIEKLIYGITARADAEVGW